MPPVRFLLTTLAVALTASIGVGAADPTTAEVRTGTFPFTPYVRSYQVWEFTPMDQGGRLVQLELIGSERDDDIVRAVRRPGFFMPWGDPIRWDSLEQTQVEKSVWLNRWYFLPSFARQYRLTGDASLLRELMAFVRRWRAENPRPANIQEYIRSRQRNWRDMQVAWRVQNLAWCYFLGADGFTPSEKRELFATIEEHAAVLLEDFGTRPLNENNHQSHGATTMLYAALLFPDMRNAAALRAKGIEILEHHLAHAFYEDGNSVELSPGYYPFFVSIFRDAYLLCRANGVVPPRGTADRLLQFYHYLGTVAQPDGTMPPINDSSESSSEPSLRILADVLGQPHPYRRSGSHGYLASHQAVMRDVSAATPAYVFLDAGPQVTAHWHGGKLGFHLCYWDRPLLVDSGISNYDNPLKLAWYQKPDAHNTLLVDGTGDYDRATTVAAKRPFAGSRIDRWESTADWDWAVMSHTGFPAAKPAVEWTRHFLLLRGVGSIIVDRLQSAGEHDYTWLFHLPPGAGAPKPDARAVFTAFPDRNLLLQPAAPDSLRLLVANGTVNRRSENLPAPVVQYVLRAKDTVQAFLLWPERGGTAPVIRFVQRPVADGVTLELDGPGLARHVRLTWPGADGSGKYALEVSP